MYLLLYDTEFPRKSIFSKIKTPVDGWLAKNELYCGSKINDNTYALGSLKGGMLLVDKNFKSFKTITDKDGLLDNAVKNIFVDQNENLWLSLNFGVSFVEFNTPVTRWTKNNGIKGVIEASVKFEGKLYIATDKGLQVLDPSLNRFVETEIGDYCFGLLIKNNELLVGTANGLYCLKNGRSKLLYEPTIYGLFTDPSDSTIIYAGTEKGLAIANYKDHRFNVTRSFDDWGDVRGAARNKDGILGFATSSNGIFILDQKNNYQVQKLTDAEGLPSLNDNFIFSYRGDFLIATAQGFYKIETIDGKLRVAKLTGLGGTFLDKLFITHASQIGDDIWFHCRINAEGQAKYDLLRSITLTEKGFQETHLMLHRIKGADAKDCFKDSNRVYIASNDGLYCYDNSLTPKQKPFFTFISKFCLKNQKEPVLQNQAGSFKELEVEIPFKQNEITVTPSASDYYDINDLQFCYYLEGKEDTYGSWSKAAEKSSENLHEGYYVLHAKARNLLGQEGKEITLAFTILPPWYRTVWAYLLYLLAATALIWLIVMLNTRRLKEQNIKLEKIITDRTKTIAHQKEEIEHKNQEITDSINYAKRIQDAILPSVKDIKKTWSDLFVFFQPKDIVSGDFYWYNKIRALQQNSWVTSA